MSATTCKRAGTARINGTATDPVDLNACELLVNFEDARHWSVPRAIVADSAGTLWGIGEDLEAPERMTPREVVQWFVASEPYGVAQTPGLARLFQIIGRQLQGGGR